MKTVAILEGWAGGPKLTQLLRKGLEAAGFKIVKNVRQADIIIAHSGGCYTIPLNVNAGLIMLIGLPYWPGQSIVSRLLKHGRTDTKIMLKQLGFWGLVRSRIWEFYYFLAKPSYTWKGLTNHSRLEFLEQLKDKKLIIVRTRDDDFCSPKIKQAVSGYKNVRYAEVPGHHADYYINPQPYINLLH